MSAPDSWEEHAGTEEAQQAAQEETQQSAEPAAEPAAAEAGAEVEADEADAEGSELTSPQTESSEAGGAPKGKKGKKEVIRDPRPHVNLVFIGHVDAGKSTISGHILYLTGMVDERTMEKYEREAKQKNRESWKYAWAMDVSEAERDKGKTHETGSGYFATKNRRFTILDAPGHKAFVPSMIGGACQADLAVLVISARRGEFETGFERGGQTREHAILTKTAGVKHLFVVINKMDDPTVEWQKSRYDEIVGKLSPFLKGVGWAPNQTQFLPVSGLGGLNLAERLDPKQVPCDWYNDQCLLEMLDTVEMADVSETEPLRFPIQGKFREMGVCVHGRNESGVFSVGDKLYMMPPKVPVIVDAILHDTDEVEQCYPGDNVLVKLKGVEEEDIHVGFVLCEIARPLPIAIAFTAQVLLLETKHIIAPGYKCVMHIHAVAEECEFEKLACTLDKKTGQPAVKAPPFVKSGDKVLAHMRMNQAICLETFKVFSKLGRFILRDESKTIGVGVVMRVLA